MLDGREKNAARFTGFADVYEGARPTMPAYPAEQIVRYLGRRPRLVVDLGCGTGLSTLTWHEIADQVIGIDPSADMLQEAAKKAADNVTFRIGYGAETGLPDTCADAVVCSQSFHWMEPSATLTEVSRILVPGGVFATVDCDWPPVARWEAEDAYMALYGKVKRLEKELPAVRDSFVRYSKDKHLQNIAASGCFRYCRELLFENTELCSAERFVNLLLSQGSLQTVRKHVPEIEKDIDVFRQKIHALYGAETFSIGFCYRMRVGIK